MSGVSRDVLLQGHYFSVSFIIYYHVIFFKKKKKNTLTSCTHLKASTSQHLKILLKVC